MSTIAATELDTPYPLDDATIRRFREDGFIRLPNVLSAETLAEYRAGNQSRGRRGQPPQGHPARKAHAVRPGVRSGHESVDAQRTHSRARVQQATGPHRGRAHGHARRADVARSGAVQRAVRRVHAVARRSAILADVQPEFDHRLDSAATGADRNGPAVLRPRQPSQTHRPRSGDQCRKRAAHPRRGRARKRSTKCRSRSRWAT